MLARGNPGSPLPPPGGGRLGVGERSEPIVVRRVWLWCGEGERSEPYYVCILRVVGEWTRVIMFVFLEIKT